MLTATRQGLENFDCNRRGRDGDYRKRGSWAVFSYFTEKGEEYRRATWADSNTPESDMWAIAPLTIEVTA